MKESDQYHALKKFIQLLFLNFSLLYTNNAGGVVALSHDNVVLINGYSNSYWGWGAEDDDFSAR